MEQTIFLIRHGKTKGNLRGAYIGTTDEPLCAQGLKELQARKEAGLYPSAGRVFTSPLKRCLQTAHLLYPNQRAFPVPVLRETDFGRFEGKSYTDLNGDPDYQRFIDSSGAIPFPEGEDPMEFRKRSAEGFLNLCRSLSEAEKAAIICHGGTIMAILDAFSSPHEEFYHWQTACGDGFRFYFDPKEGRAYETGPLLLSGGAQT